MDDDVVVAAAAAVAAAPEPEPEALTAASTSVSPPLPLQFSAELYVKTAKEHWDRVELHIYDHSLALVRCSDDDDDSKAAQQKVGCKYDESTTGGGKSCRMRLGSGS